MVRRPIRKERSLCAKQRRGRFAGFALAIVCAVGATFGARAAERQRVWHFAANENFDAAGAFLPSSAGFNLADVSSRRELELLPRGAMGLVWVGQCEGVTAKFEAVVGAIINHPKTFGFYLVDDPTRPDAGALNAKRQTSAQSPIGFTGAARERLPSWLS